MLLLGNLSISEIEARLGIDFPAETKSFMEKRHQSSASNVEKGKWHCFDIPFTMLCGDMDTATKIYESVKDKASECKEALHFAIQE